MKKKEKKVSTPDKPKVSRYTSANYVKWTKTRQFNVIVPRMFERAGLDKFIISTAANDAGSNRNEFVSAALLYAIENPEIIKRTIKEVKRDYSEVDV